MKKEKKEKTEMTYEQAMERLEILAEEIRNDDKNIDRLVDLLKEASSLVEFCRNKLIQVEEEIKEILPEEDK